jgi:acyl carrier protein
MKREILQAINLFFQEKNKETPILDLDIFELGLIDSMELLELIIYLESELDIRVDQELMTVDNFRSVSSIVKTLSIYE